MEQKKCKSCGKNIEGQSALFCSNCGVRLDRKSKISPKHLMAVLTFAVILTFASVAISNSKLGKRPVSKLSSKPHASSMAANELFKKDDNFLKSLREKVRADKESKQALKELADALELEYANFAGSREVAAPPELVIEYIEVLSKLSRQEPIDYDSLLKLAQVSFESKVFDRSAIAYKIYLEQFPKDDDVRAKYASTLAFTGDLKGSKAELASILKTNPQHFQANAFLAISYAQSSEIDLALKYAEIALKNAPNEEAKSRFIKFIESIKGASDVSTDNGSLQPLYDYLEGSPITSNKFVRAEISGETLKIYFKDFPVSKMPEMAKNTFALKLKTAVQGLNVKSIEVIDDASGQVLEVFK